MSDGGVRIVGTGRDAERDEPAAGEAARRDTVSTTERTEAESSQPPDGPAGAGEGDTRADEPKRRRLTVGLATVAALGMLGTVGFGVAWWRADDATHRQDSARNTTRDFLLALTNFDAATVDADFARIQSYATGDFANQANQFFGSQVRQALKQVQASSRGEVRSLYVESLSGGTASVFGVVDQTIINSKFTGPEADELRIDVTLRRVGGHWRVSEVNVLQAPPVASPLPSTTTTTAPAAKP